MREVEMTSVFYFMRIFGKSLEFFEKQSGVDRILTELARWSKEYPVLDEENVLVSVNTLKEITDSDFDEEDFLGGYWDLKNEGGVNVFFRKKNLLYAGGYFEVVRKRVVSGHFISGDVLSYSGGDGRESTVFMKVRQPDLKMAELIDFHNPVSGEFCFRKVVWKRGLTSEKTDVVYVNRSGEVFGRLCFRGLRKGKAREVEVSLSLSSGSGEQKKERRISWVFKMGEGNSIFIERVSGDIDESFSETFDLKGFSYFEVYWEAFCEADREGKMSTDFKRYMNNDGVSFDVPELNMMAYPVMESLLSGL